MLFVFFFFLIHPMYVRPEISPSLSRSPSSVAAL